MGLITEKVEVDLREDQRNWKIPGGHGEAGPQGRNQRERRARLRESRTMEIMTSRICCVSMWRRERKNSEDRSGTDYRRL